MAERAPDWKAWSTLKVMLRTAKQLATVRGKLEQTLEALEANEIFTLPQALTLAAVTIDFDPDVVIDLGTGRGGSSCTFAIATSGPRTTIYTFDVGSNWSDYVQPRLPVGDWSRIKPIVADITKFDFASLLEKADRVLVFLDAHGFEVAARLLSHILPLIADKDHVVFCHDISDNRMADTDEVRSYGGKRLWRGTAHYFDNMETTALLNLGWMVTAVEQAIAVYDFCYRNRISLRSVDEDVHLKGDHDDKAKLQKQLFACGLPRFHLAYFTMEETNLRHFPAG